MARALACALFLFVLPASASAQFLPPPPPAPQDLPTVEPVARGTTAGRLFELWRIPRVSQNPLLLTLNVSVILRVTPVSFPAPSCQISFTLIASYLPEINNKSRPLGACPDGIATIHVFFYQCVRDSLGRPHCDLVHPTRNAVSIEVDGITVVSLPALPTEDAQPNPTLEAVSVGCNPCLPGQVLDIFAVARNFTGEPITADYRPYGFTAGGEEFLIEWASGIVTLHPGDTVLSLTGPWTIPTEIPAGYYFFGARLLHSSGRSLAETGHQRVVIGDCDLYFFTCHPLAASSSR